MKLDYNHTHCVKCGRYIRSEKDRIDWDISGSMRRIICRECAEEEGLCSEDE